MNETILRVIEDSEKMDWEIVSENKNAENKVRIDGKKSSRSSLGLNTCIDRKDSFVIDPSSSNGPYCTDNTLQDNEIIYGNTTEREVNCDNIPQISSPSKIKILLKSYFPCVLIFSVLVVTMQLKASRISNLQLQVELREMKELLKVYRTNLGWMKKEEEKNCLHMEVELNKTKELLKVYSKNHEWMTDNNEKENNFTFGPCLHTQWKYMKQAYKMLHNQTSNLLYSNIKGSQKMIDASYFAKWFHQRSNFLSPTFNGKLDELKDKQESYIGTFHNNTVAILETISENLKLASSEINEQMQDTIGLMAEANEVILTWMDWIIDST